jgi:hypothetical protein
LITTTLYGLKKPEDGDSADLILFVSDNMDILEAKLNDIETEGIPVASPTNLGGIMVGTGLAIDPTGVLSTTPYTLPLMSIDTIGGAMVGNGLGMVGDYLIVRTGTGLEIDPAMLNVSIDRDVVDTWYAPIGDYITNERTGTTSFVDSIWRGTQAEYDVVTKDPNTIYYIVG